ncbi:Maf family protein [Rothia sp. P7181]|uniref:Maf family protein n=1 Tax=unclassified Rothia (in: high G+C Gram-positive bacteria) TaxID=2689056 RepID=UPI003AD2BE22
MSSFSLVSDVEPTLVLASSSPARQKLLRDAGIIFQVCVSSVDEDAVVARAQKDADVKGLGELTPAQVALLLARAKAEDVARLVDVPGAIVLGCDSVFELDGVAYGKPHDASTAVERLRLFSGASGLLHTGHWLIDTRVVHGRSSSELRTATVHCDALSEDQIHEYVATGEPLAVAGSFTIDGFGSAFIRGIEGEYHTVVGLSVNALKDMLADLGLSITNFWTKTA